LADADFASIFTKLESQSLSRRAILLRVGSLLFGKLRVGVAKKPPYMAPLAILTLIKRNALPVPNGGTILPIRVWVN
jgi:hypothetical protein